MNEKALKSIKSRSLGFTMLFVVGFLLALVGSGLLKADVVYAAESKKPEVAGELPIDAVQHKIDIPAKGKVVYYSVTPEYSGYYCVDSNASDIYFKIFEDENTVGDWKKGGSVYKILEKDKTYYIGFRLASSATESDFCWMRISASIDSSKEYQLISEKVYIKAGASAEESCDANLYYKPLEYGKAYKAICTTKYKVCENYYSSYTVGDYIDGLPTEPGRYIIYYTGVYPFMGSQSHTIEVYDASDFFNFTFINNAPDGYYNGTSYYYTGKPFDLSYIQIKRQDEVMHLGKDYICAGYCTQAAYNMSNNMLKWKEGTPTEPGKYMLKLVGINDCKGTKYYSIRIEKAVDLEYALVTDVKTSSESCEIKGATAGLFRIKPSKTGKYTINLSKEKGTIFMTVLDKNGAILQAVESDREDKLHLSTEIELSEGEDYYLYISDHQATLLYGPYSPGNAYICSFTINIPGYSFYAPATTEEDKKTDDKTDDKKNQTDSDKTSKKTKQENDSNDAKKTSEIKPLAKGKTFKSGGITYKVTVSKKGKYQVAFVKNNKNAKKITVKDSVKYKGVTYKITSIGSSAFRNNKKLETVTLGKNITKIGKPAFKGCIKLKKVKVPKTKLNNYKKLLKKAGLKSNVKVSFK